MSLVRLTGVTRYFGADHIFGPVDLAVNPGDRIGLIGPNGSGKSSLLEIIAGATPDEGEVSRAKDLGVVYLRQEGTPRVGESLFEYVMAAFAPLLEQEATLRALEAQMADPAIQGNEERLDALMARYARLLSTFEEGGGYEREARGRSALFGLGFSEAELDRPLNALSGGQRARAHLARLLLTPADLLLLDEPTNHLDLAATEWLQAFLERETRAFILVSHDRHLLDALARTIWEIEAPAIHMYPGNYSASREQAALRRERLEKEYQREQEERERLEAFVRKWGAGTRASQAKSRARRLERMGEGAPPPVRREVQARFTVPEGPRSERRVASFDGACLGYGDRPVLFDLNLEITRGDRIGIVGANGSGKSTLLRSLVGELPPIRGHIDVGRGVRIGYYAQHRIDLDPEKTVLEEALAGKDQLVGEARTFLARFLFRGDDVFKRVGVLSGGEKSRLALAKLLLQGGNLLLLDEPTNHLDIGMAEALEEALKGYAGTLVVVTHDRALLSAIATHLWWVEDGRIHVVDGGYPALRQWLAQREALAKETKEAAKAVAPDRQRTEGARQRDERRLRRTTEEQLAAVEDAIEKLTARKKELEERLADPQLYRRGEEARQAAGEHQEVLAALAEHEQEWTRLAEKLETIDPA